MSETIQIKGVDLILDSYRIPGTFRHIPVTIQRMETRDGVRWAILQGSECMNNEGKWEYHHSSSHRTDEFLKRCRFATLEAAVDVWIKSGKIDAFQEILATPGESTNENNP